MRADRGRGFGPAAVLCGLLGAPALAASGPPAPFLVLSQAEAPTAEFERTETKTARPPKPKPRRASEESKPEAKPDAKPAVSPLAGAAAAGAEAAPLNIAAKLTQNGVRTCASAIDAEAVASMVGVSESNTVSLWSNVEPRDRHAASVFIGQRYAGNPVVPYGVTGLIASPTPSGSCDVTAVQVVASPLPCAKVRDTLARGGKLLGEIAGMPLVQSADGQTLLMPTATNTCVLVGFHAKFGN